MPAQDALFIVIQRLSLCRDLNSVIDVLKEAARDLTGAEGVTVVLRDGDLCHYADESAVTPLWKGQRFPMSACISGWCMLNRQQVAIPDIYADDRIPHNAYRPTFVKSLVMTPIRREAPLGAIGAYWSSKHHPTQETLRLLQALADTAAVAFANIELIGSLQAANRRKDEFLLMLAHELRNPLAPIFNALRVLGLEAQGQSEQFAKAHALLERQARHLTRIVDDLLDGARIARGKFDLRIERLDLGQVIQEVCADHDNEYRERGLQLALDLPETPVWVNGDKTRLTQVLANILDNAAKFSPQGGDIQVSLATEATEATEREAVISISDRGIGIEPEMLPFVFDVFAQADHSLDRATGGLGMGLSMVKGILELHQGNVEAFSAGEGLGTTLVIRLPQVLEPPALRPVAEIEQPTGGNRRVLVVEDNRDAADSLRMLLELCGYEVSLAHTGLEGVEAAKRFQPDIILCDIGLPGLNGFDVAKRLRQDPRLANAKLIAVTGYGQEQDRRRALESGFDAHLVKPVEPDRLLQHLSQ